MPTKEAEGVRRQPRRPQIRFRWQERSVGDWNGDGANEIGLHRELSAFYYHRNTLTTGVADGQFYFGNPADRFIPGDWVNLDGIETPGLFRPSDHTPTSATP